VLQRHHHGDGRVEIVLPREREQRVLDGREVLPGVALLVSRGRERGREYTGSVV
jgi:hypothetical protein